MFEVESEIADAPLPLTCEAVNDRGHWIFSAPGSLFVSVTSEPLRITCKAPEGAGVAGPTETLFASTAGRNVGVGVGVGVGVTIGLSAVTRGLAAVLIAPLRDATDGALSSSALRYPGKVTLRVVRDDASTREAPASSPRP